jgi:hypothetical protein
MTPLRNSNIRVPGVTQDDRGIWWCDTDNVPVGQRNNGTYVCPKCAGVFEVDEELPDSRVTMRERLRSWKRRS